MYKLEFKDKDYNRMSFVFETTEELVSFMKVAFEKSVKELTATVSKIEEESEVEE